MIPNTRRFFVDAGAIRGDEVVIADAELAHQLQRVLRLGPGERILLLDGRGSAYEVELVELERAQVVGRVVSQTPARGEPPYQLTLYLALMRMERFEWALQKGVELGAVAIVPVRFSRSLPGEHADEKKLARWRRIVRETAEQSCRGLLAEVAAPLGFAQALESATAAELGLILWEGEAAPLRQVLGERANAQGTPATIAMFSGPVGGIAAEELTAACERGIIPVSLGARILRAETAPIAAAAAIAYEFEPAERVGMDQN